MEASSALKKKEAQCLQEAVCETLSWSRHSASVLGSPRAHLCLFSSKCAQRLIKRKCINAVKWNSRWRVKKKRNPTYLWDFSCDFTFPAKWETFYCNSIYLEEPKSLQVIHKGESGLLVSRLSFPSTNTHTHIPFLILLILILSAQSILF